MDFKKESFEKALYDMFAEGKHKQEAEERAKYGSLSKKEVIETVFAIKSMYSQDYDAFVKTVLEDEALVSCLDDLAKQKSRSFLHQDGLFCKQERVRDLLENDLDALVPSEQMTPAEEYHLREEAFLQQGGTFAAWGQVVKEDRYLSKIAEFITRS